MYDALSVHKIHCEEDLRNNHARVLLCNLNLFFQKVAQSSTLLIIHEQVEVLVTLIYFIETNYIATLPQLALDPYLIDHLYIVKWILQK